jgi:protease-4
MPSIMRALLWVLLMPFRALGWAMRTVYVRVWGYSVLRFRIHGRLSDRQHPPRFFGILPGEKAGPSLVEILLALDRARRDPRIETVFVSIGGIQAGLGRVEEVREALARVRDAGKRVVAYLEEGGLQEYGVALGAGEIVLPPAGGINVTGVASEVILLKGLLDRAGITAWMRARGKYKSMREMFAEPEMTEANREMTSALVGDLHAQVVEAISTSRRMSPDAVRALLDRGPFLATEAKELGLIDALEYEDQLKDRVEAETAKFRPVELSSYLVFSSHLATKGKPARVALLEVSGHIKSGPSAPGQDAARATGSEKFASEVDALRKDPRVHAIVLRVNSPGGSALASDVMWRALTRASEKKPLVVSMVDVAASGGYFVSGVRGAKVFASNATITGSIGVLSGKFDATGLYALLGVKKEIIAGGARGGYFSEARGFTPDEVQKLESDLDAHYEHFLARMSEGRGKPRDELHAVAQGRVWTGRQALHNGLVDERGGLLAALAAVRERLNLQADAPLAILSTRKERRRFPLRLEWRVPETAIPEVLMLPLRLAEYFRSERVLALLPFDFRFR